MTADGEGTRALTREGDWQQPFWSPDGRRLAVAAKRAAHAPTRILVLDLDGGAVRPIAQPDETDNVHPAWSPDGRFIVFTSGKGADAALWRFSFA
jgi:TolB protein